MMSRSDATPAYRGYRLQALYTLFRILESVDTEELVFQPEGEEDLAIFLGHDQLIEVIQVKAYSSDLVLSSLSPNQADSFFYRAVLLLKSAPEATVSIASFGNIGAELFQATTVNGRDRKNVAKKLSNSKYITEVEAEKLIARIKLVPVTEQELEQKVYTFLINSLTSVDPERAFELLNFWLYICAEQKRKITRQDVIQRISNVGKFVAERAAHHREWFTSIVPIEDYKIEEQTQKELSEEFYQGISARYEHILANLDVVRPRFMHEIEAKFRENRIVIIHGASGQGKSTLAYRYLSVAFPDQWRFRIKVIDSREHALSVATALVAQADSIGISIAVYLDVSASDSGWAELVKQLADHHSIRVLVTIREEDFQRASISGSDFSFSTIQLTFDHTEAEHLYEILTAKHPSTELLHFEEAWKRFGGEGPLMEFVYLITQGNSLRERLAQQVKRLEDEVREGKVTSAELDLLRLVSVASAFEARLKVKPLVEYLGLPSPKRTFQLFEKEYLLRLSDDGSLTSGLHPIRSTILADVLLDPTFAPWSASACTCLSLMEELDVETFLLYTFSRRKKDIPSFLNALISYQPTRWAAIAGVTRALLWLGILEYIEANRALIQEVFDEPGGLHLLDFDITDAVPGSASLWDNLVSPEGREKIQTLQARQTNKKAVFAQATAWLSRRVQVPVVPIVSTDWSGLAEVSFWLGYLNIPWPLMNWVGEDALTEALQTVSLDVWADLVLGLSRRDDVWFDAWLQEHRSTLIDRFRKEFQVITFEDDGQKVTAHFIIAVNQLGSTESVKTQVQKTKDHLHDSALHRINMMYGLFPDREFYACQGYGHRLWNMPYDSTQKTGIARSKLPSLWLTSINATFRGLAEMFFRPQTWQDYASSIFILRKKVLDGLKQLELALDVYFKKQKMVALLNNHISEDEWKGYELLFRRPTLLPGCALDEWGFVDELASALAHQEMQEQVSLLRKRGLVMHLYKPFLEVYKEYDRGMSNFFRQSLHAMALNPVLGKECNSQAARERVLQQAPQLGIKPELVRLSTINFADAVKSLQYFQREFRSLLAQFVNHAELESLERREHNNFLRVWSMWYFFSMHPERVLPVASQQSMGQLMDLIKQVRSKLRKELRTLSSSKVQIGILSEDVLWDGERALWLHIDGSSAVEVYGSVEAVIKAIRHAFSAVQNTELRRYALNFFWPHIVVIASVRGKLLNPTAWRISLLVLLQDRELSWWNYVQHAIPNDATAKLKLTMWALPQLETPKTFMQSLGELSLLAAHIRDIKSLPDVDESGVAMLQDYLQAVADQMSLLLQAVLDSEEMLTNRFNVLATEEQQQRPNLVGAVEALLELHKTILPSSDFEKESFLSLEAIGRWADSLEHGHRYAFIAYLFWITDVLDEVVG